MSEALERVIAEHQKKIDGMSNLISRQVKEMHTIFTRHDELFREVAKLIDSNNPNTQGERDTQSRLKESVWRMMQDTGYYFCCRSFICECDCD